MKRLNLNTKFNEYYNEVENYGLRSERFHNDVMMMNSNPILNTRQRCRVLERWLEAAFIAGARAMAQDTVDKVKEYDENQLKDIHGMLMVYFTKVLQDAEEIV